MLVILTIVNEINFMAEGEQLIPQLTSLSTIFRYDISYVQPILFARIYC